MIRIGVQNRHPRLRVKPARIRSQTRHLLRILLQRTDAELTLRFVDHAAMTQANELWLRHAGTTDVITFDHSGFPGSSPAMLDGELLICLDEAERQARRRRIAPDWEVVRYVVHGILHLCGYRDDSPAARRQMKREEDRLLRALRAPSPPTQPRLLRG